MPHEATAADQEGRAPDAFVTATHEVLFASETTVRCDACGEALPTEDDDDSFAITGRGLLVWARGDEVRREEPPLCASCAAAIGLTALSRWELEEEEG